MKNDEVLDALSEAIENTINNFINTDIYYYIAPHLSKSTITKECPFFQDNRLTLSTELVDPLENIDIYPSTQEYPSDTLYPSNTVIFRDYTSEELKTIAYLGLFQRNRVAYNPKNIDFYLRTLGYLAYDKSLMNILCFEGGECGNETKNIDYEEWTQLS